ncbi:hypothetical protein C8A00DRAFT_38107 [Chaetomidium leptoderma]|uniref:Arb2 domain-containing protein n=1 Tax=Chaetomidium leptoderma TaxID=669021 RepID=A0AAN6ZTA9_9PEZI|nr:hypothetical protein C8A00DRAFT_38107 [Chaetomidium leptoderma]
MFRRRWSGLPADPVFESDFKELGYFINDIDEIRSVEDPDYYFKYFLTKNERWNECQRFAFNQAVIKEIRTRLDTQGFTTVPLPLGTPTTQPHVPILTSPDLSTKSRVVLLIGESYQPLGVLAHRVIGGRGGITRGSVLSLVAALNGQQSSAADPSPPGIVLANAGELWWWPEGGKGLTPMDRHRVPMASAVHLGRYHDPKVNEVPGNRTVAEHVRAVFENVVLGGLVNSKATIDVIAVGDAVDEVERYLDDDAVWERLGGKLGCLVVLGGFYDSKKFRCERFRRFMKERARAYIIHHTPLDTPVAGAGGNPGAAGFTSFGCPVYSAGEAQVTETMLIEAQPAVLEWIQEVALEGAAYKNAVIEVFGEEGSGITTEELDSAWGAPETNASEEDEAKARTEVKAKSNRANGDGREEQESAEVEDDKTKTSVKAAKDGQSENNRVNGGGSEAQEPASDTAKADVKAQAVEDSQVINNRVSGYDRKPQFSPAPDGPEARDMKELVKELEELKIDN